MINKLILVGNIGSDPKKIETKSGKDMVSFSVATSESYKDKNGEYQTKTEWHNIVCFDEIKNKYIFNNIKKGDSVFIDAKLTYQDKDINGTNIKQISINLKEIKILRKQIKEENSKNESEYNEDDSSSDEIPF